MKKSLKIKWLYTAIVLLVFVVVILFFWIVNDYNGKVITSASNKKIEYLSEKCDSINKELIFQKKIELIQDSTIVILDKTIELMKENR